MARTSEDMTYLSFHVVYTIPLTFVLWLIVRPFMNASLWVTTLIISALALIYTTPWDNFMVWSGAWSFADEASLFNIGFLPVEEYFFFVIQTVMVMFWSILCLRWSLPGLCLDVTPVKANIIRWVPAVLMMIASVISWFNIVPGTPPFYFCSVIGWTFPIFAFLWIGVGNYVVQRRWGVLVAIVTPSLYLAYADNLAIYEDVWTVSPKAVVGIYLSEKMPIEEAFFFFAVSALVVLGFCAVEKSNAVIHNFPEQFHGNIFLKMLYAFFRLESTLESERIEDLRRTLNVLHGASKSFWAASHVFPPALRQDLGVLYAFCRVTDDMVDDLCLTQDQKHEKLKMIRDFLDKLFAGRKQNSKFKYSVDYENSGSKKALVDWNYYGGILSRDELAAFRSLSRLEFQIPAEPLYELCEGYEWDIAGRTVKTEADLVEYSEYVASSVGVLCTFMAANESRDWFVNFPRQLPPNPEDVIRAAREMGVALQLTNIARDIVTDSETLGRCYVPKDFMNETEFQALLDRKPWTLGETVLQRLSVRILDLADENKSRAQRGIQMIPRSMQPGVIAATDIYSAIGKVLRKADGYPKRASVSVAKKLWILIRAIYFAKV